MMNSGAHLQSLVLPTAFEVDSFSSVILSPKPFCKKSRPFHQIFEKVHNLLFDGRHGDRLRFYDCLPSQPLQTLSENVVVAVATPTLSFLSLRVSIYMTSGRYEVHLFCRGSPGQLRSSSLRAWEQLKQRRVWSGLNSGPARPSAARFGNGARRGRRYARCSAATDPQTILLPPSQLRIRSRGARKPWADWPGLSLLFCSRHDKGARKRYAQRAEDPLRVFIISCAPLSSSAPPGSLGCWPNKHLPAAPAARLTGGALVILTVLSAGALLIALAISYGSSSSQPQGPTLRGQSGLSGQPPFELLQQTVAPPTRKGINIETSLPFESENLWRKSGFKFPETIRLYSQREYAAPKIIPSAANVATKLFLWKALTKMRNSPIKLLVPGPSLSFPPDRAVVPRGRPVAAENELGRAPGGRAASSLSGWNKKGKLVVGGKTRLVECDSTEEPYSIGALARYN
ncbi:Detected protein of unknown function [Hibiscus syriacus]|uniref:Uncharacterized protein n=1 Tax=Hibiscus syriacus TaxID=106335 RepID=A0A6A2X3H8_HIBSY|nr:Detected protein of unknown function [Hibiscus syriacus]